MALFLDILTMLVHYYYYMAGGTYAHICKLSLAFCHKHKWTLESDTRPNTHNVLILNTYAYAFTKSSLTSIVVLKYSQNKRWTSNRVTEPEKWRWETKCECYCIQSCVLRLSGWVLRLSGWVLLNIDNKNVI